MAGVRAVLDTHVWLDWLVFDDPSVGPIRDAQAAGRIEIVIDEACEAELQRVLAYDLGKHSLEPDAQAECIARCRALAKRVEPGAAEGLPKCSDMDDQKFLELALAANADLLLTKDKALLELARRERRFRILTPQEWEAL
jgi:putative PIN family toxin of toxin-antitoxin system